MVDKIKVIVKQLAIAFFFTAFFIFLTLTITKTKIDKAINFINSFAIIQNNNKGTTKNIQINTVTKRLVEYPNFGDIWARIIINSADIESNVYHGDTLDLLKYGVGHHAGSYFPGEGGTILIAGHNTSDQFEKLPKVNKGDKINDYEIIEAKALNEKLEINDNKEILMVYTCYPVDTPGYKSKRYVIYASLVGDSNE